MPPVTAGSAPSTPRTIEQEIEALDERMAAEMDRHADLSVQAEALDQADLEDVLGMLSEGDELPDIRGDLDRSVRDLALMQRARGMLLERLDATRAAEKERQRDEWRPKWREAVRRLASAAVALAFASYDELAARSQLSLDIDLCAGFTWPFDLRDPHSRVRIWLRSLVNRGYLTPDEEKKLREGPK
jgi:hypothetical protein